MKKILLLLLSGLLIIGLAGSAMAGSAKLVQYDPSTKTIGGELSGASTPQLAAGQSLFGKFVVTDYSSSQGGKSYTLSAVVKATENANGDLLGSDNDVQVTFDPINTLFTLPAWTKPLPQFVVDNVIKIEMVNPTPDAIYTVTIKANGCAQSQIELASASTDVTAVPEFPTIALPVAGMIGLLFIFGRKKGDL